MYRSVAVLIAGLTAGGTLLAGLAGTALAQGGSTQNGSTQNGLMKPVDRSVDEGLVRADGVMDNMAPKPDRLTPPALPGLAGPEGMVSLLRGLALVAPNALPMFGPQLLQAGGVGQAAGRGRPVGLPVSPPAGLPAAPPVAVGGRAARMPVALPGRGAALPAGRRSALRPPAPARAGLVPRGDVVEDNPLSAMVRNVPPVAGVARAVPKPARARLHPTGARAGQVTQDVLPLP